jgi:hypothetical protein
MMDQMSTDELTDLLESTLENALEAWKADAYGCIVKLATAGRPFTADDVHAMMVGRWAPGTVHPNVMGAVFARARRDGIITTHNHYRPSVRRDAHRRMVRVWEGV